MSTEWSQSNQWAQRRPSRTSARSGSSSHETSSAKHHSLADSTVSYTSGWTGEDVDLRISQFPRPPTSLPPPALPPPPSWGRSHLPPALERTWQIPNQVPRSVPETASPHSDNPDTPSSEVTVNPYATAQYWDSPPSVRASQERLLSTSFIAEMLTVVPRDPSEDGEDTPTPTGLSNQWSNHPRNPYGQYGSTGYPSPPSHAGAHTYPPAPPEHPLLPSPTSVRSNSGLEPPGRQSFSASSDRPSLDSRRSDGSPSQRSSTSHDGGSSSNLGVVRTASRTWRHKTDVVGLAPAVYTNPDEWKRQHPNSLNPADFSAPSTSRLHSPLSPSPSNIYSPESVHLRSLKVADVPKSVRRLSRDSIGGLSAYQELEAPRPAITPALPSTPITYFPPSPPASHKQPTRRPSVAASGKSSIISRISRSTQASKSRGLAWILRTKELPPLPKRNHSMTSSRREKYEIDVPLPVLARRAEVLSDMLAEGKLPRPSLGSASARGYTDEKAVAGSKSIRSVFTAFSDRSKRSQGQFTPLEDDRPPMPPRSQWEHLTRLAPGSDPPASAKAGGVSMRKAWTIVGIVIAIIALIVGLAVGLTVKGTSDDGTTCSNTNTTGALCDLDATCVCTSTTPGRCDPVAQSLVNLTPLVAQLFNTTVTPSALSLALWDVLGSAPTGTSNCAVQAALVDIGPGLSVAKSPIRATWARAAILYSVFRSQDVDESEKLRKFVASSDFSSLAGNDAATTDPSQRFTILASGFIFDFAAMTVTAPTVTFRTGGSPSDAQLARAGQQATAALDRMYTFATASSNQRTKALSNYWSSTLKLDPADLPRFLSAVRSAPIHLPFDGTFSKSGQSISNAYPPNTADGANESFPPALGCYPALSNAQISRINMVETPVFGLPAITASPTAFSKDCNPNRPVYGVLNLLRLRLPFPDSREQGVALQASVLSSDASSRAVIRSGELLSALPSVELGGISDQSMDPREFGTLNRFNHVILNYLQSLPSIEVAKELVGFVLSQSTTPPPLFSLLYNSTSSIPLLEVSVFGSVVSTDLTSSVSSFSTPTGALFFGSVQGQAFRVWALRQPAASIAWTELSSSAQVVRELPTVDNTFEQVWTAAGRLISNAIANGATTGKSEVDQVVATFERLGSFSA